MKALLAVLSGLLLLGSPLLWTSWSQATQPQTVTDNHENPRSNFIFVAMIGGLDLITHIHVNNLLNRHRIDHSIAGSRGFGISVRRQEVDRVKQLLREDSSRWKYWIVIGKNVYKVPKTEWIDVEMNSKISRLRPAPHGRLPEALLKTIHHPSLAKYHYLKRIHFRQRIYLNEKGELQTGYEGNVELTVSLSSHSESINQTFQVYGNMPSIELLGAAIQIPR